MTRIDSNWAYLSIIIKDDNLGGRQRLIVDTVITQDARIQQQSFDAECSRNGLPIPLPRLRYPDPTKQFLEIRVNNSVETTGVCLCALTTWHQKVQPGQYMWRRRSQMSSLASALPLDAKCGIALGQRERHGWVGGDHGMRGIVANHQEIYTA